MAGGALVGGALAGGTLAGGVLAGGGDSVDFRVFFTRMIDEPGAASVGEPIRLNPATPIMMTARMAAHCEGKGNEEPVTGGWTLWGCEWGQGSFTP